MLDWFWSVISLVKILLLVGAYIVSGGLAAFIYTVRTLRRYPDQKRLDKTDKEGLVPVIIFSPIVLLYYFAIGLTIPYKAVVWLAEAYALKDREKRQLAEKRREENEKLANMTPEERLADLQHMLEEAQKQEEEFQKKFLPEAKTDFISTMSSETSQRKRTKVARG